MLLLSKDIRKGNCCHDFAGVVDGNVSENEDELDIEFQGSEVKSSASNTALILNIFEI